MASPLKLLHGDAKMKSCCAVWFSCFMMLVHVSISRGSLLSVLSSTAMWQIFVFDTKAVCKTCFQVIGGGFECMTATRLGRRVVLSDETRVFLVGSLWWPEDSTCAGDHEHPSSACTLVPTYARSAKSARDHCINGVFSLYWQHEEQDGTRKRDLPLSIRLTPAVDRSIINRANQNTT